MMGNHALFRTSRLALDTEIQAVRLGNPAIIENDEIAIW
jgi:hypothetical protein